MVRNWRGIPVISLFVGLCIATCLLGVGVGQLAGGAYGKLGLYALGAIVGALLLTLIIMFHKVELAVVVVFAAHLYVDFYLALYVIALIMALTLLLFFYLMRSAHYPWMPPRTLWLWALLLVLAIFPSIQGAFSNGVNYYDLYFYYPNVIFGAFLFYWLGSVATRNGAGLRLLLRLLALLAVLVAIHTIIEELTGITLFSTAAHDTFLQGVSDYQLGDPGSNVHRAGSFFTDPNWNGTFLAMTLFIPLALFAERPAFLEKLFYLSEVFVILLALLFTYSVGSLIGAAAGFIVFLVFVGQGRYRLLLPLCASLAVISALVFFPTQIGALLQHATNPNETSLRVGIWQTALHVIQAYPWTGTGFSHILYEQISNAYRVPQQYIPESHPHNSYLELAAMGGIPTLALFLILAGCALWFALRNWAFSDPHQRSLIAGGIAAIAALSVNAWTINAWTLPPIAAMGWLILGMIASPLLAHKQGTAQEASHIAISGSESGAVHV